jgi:hypothetical protein
MSQFRLNSNGDWEQRVSSLVSKALVITVGADIEPTQGVTSNTDVSAQLIFAEDNTATTVSLIAGVVYPYSIKKVVAGTGIVGLY